MDHPNLSGVIAAIATPVDEAGEPDIPRVVTLARFLLGNGCDGLNVLGTTGEATSFSLAQRKAVMSAYRDARLPLGRMMVGTGAAAAADAIALTRHAADLGFAGALVLPPFYYKGVPDDGLAAYVDIIVQASASKPIPIYLYHYPALSGLPWHVTLIRRLLASHGGRIVGLKDFLRRYGLCPRSRHHLGRFQGVPVDRGGIDRCARRHLCRLHLGHGEPQCRSVCARVSERRCRGA